MHFWGLCLLLFCQVMPNLRRKSPVKSVQNGIIRRYKISFRGMGLRCLSSKWMKTWRFIILLAQRVLRIMGAGVVETGCFIEITTVKGYIKKWKSVMAGMIFVWIVVTIFGNYKSLSVSHTFCNTLLLPDIWAWMDGVTKSGHLEETLRLIVPRSIWKKGQCFNDAPQIVA